RLRSGNLTTTWLEIRNACRRVIKTRRFIELTWYNRAPKKTSRFLQASHETSSGNARNIAIFIDEENF
ncbi:MAG: hypothetical protein ABI416_13965, partial [Ginsengibacter sp.]